MKVADIIIFLSTAVVFDCVHMIKAKAAVLFLILSLDTRVYFSTKAIMEITL